MQHELDGKTIATTDPSVSLQLAKSKFEKLKVFNAAVSPSVKTLNHQCYNGANNPHCMIAIQKDRLAIGERFSCLLHFAIYIAH